MTNQSISGQLADGEHEDAQVSRLITWLSAMAILFLVGIGAKAWYANHHGHAWVLWLFALVSSSTWRTSPRPVTGPHRKVACY